MYNGPAYDAGFDYGRLNAQTRRIFAYMRTGRWHTLAEIEEATSDPPSSISAQLRHLRKQRFGAHTVNRRIRGDRKGGLYEYQLVVNSKVERLNETNKG